MLGVKKQLLDDFRHYFPGNNDDIRLFFAPGRVNLIGEHTDYNGGYVLPAALSKGTYMVCRVRHDGEFHLKSANFPDQTVHFSINQLDYKTSDDWGNYPKGIISELKKAGTELTGADIYYYGEIPNGAGLSSSASIGMVTAFGFCQVCQFSMSLIDTALLCQRMENHYIGVNSGIMDQFAVGFGKKDHAMFLNCGTHEFDLVPLRLGNYKLVITNTNKRRGLADSKYNERIAECQRGLAAIQELHPEYNTLTDISLDDIEKVKNKLEPVVEKRMRHVATENERVVAAVKALESDHLEAFGKLMIASHESLRNDYEVTGQHLDMLFDIQQDCKGCIGTRMTGAGFGGCTVSIVKGEQIESFKEQVTMMYTGKFGLEPSFYISEIGDGVKEFERVTGK
ncbi:galactokinase [Scopulibacillus darangshiensis]|uniref:Galactokinase n=1 Tax=Scopulibacillus darangshiensis TaxID=442528 RepID=A0A4R2NRH5_9BACL|nr:galactokinase [Scopulibacillus darangshiensis]TCP24539.1 galactokinase [Scopulibacillus darangshiensis]